MKADSRPARELDAKSIKVQTVINAMYKINCLLVDFLVMRLLKEMIANITENAKPVGLSYVPSIIGIDLKNCPVAKYIGKKEERIKNKSINSWDIWLLNTLKKKYKRIPLVGINNASKE